MCSHGGSLAFDRQPLFLTDYYQEVSIYCWLLARGLSFQLPGYWQEASISNFPESCLSILKTWFSASKRSKRGQRGNHSAFCDLVSEVIYHYSYHISVVRTLKPKIELKGRGIRLHLWRGSQRICGHTLKSLQCLSRTLPSVNCEIHGHNICHNFAVNICIPTI